MNRSQLINKIINEKLNLRLLVEEYRSDKDLIFSLLDKQYKISFFEIGDELKSDKEIVLRLFRTVGDFSHISKELTKDVSFLKELLKKEVGIFRYLSKDVLENKELILDFLKNKEQIKKDSINNQDRGGVSFYYYLPESLKNDKEIILKLLDLDTSFFKDLSLDYRNNKKLVLKLLKNSSSILEYCSDSLKDDKDVVLAAASNYLNNFSCISARLKNDKDVVLQVIRNDGYFYNKISQELRDDKDVIFALIDSGNTCNQLLNLSSKYNKNEEIINYAIKKNGKNIYYLDSDVKNSLNIIKEISAEILLDESFIKDIKTQNVMSFIIEKCIEVNMSNISNSKIVCRILIQCEKIPLYNKFLKKEVEGYLSYAEVVNDKPDILEILLNNVLKEEMMKDIVFKAENDKTKRLKF